MEQEKEGHKKAIKKEDEELGDVAVGSVLFNVVAGIIMPASLFVTVPLSLAAVGESIEQNKVAVKGMYDSFVLVYPFH